MISNKQQEILSALLPGRLHFNAIAHEICTKDGLKEALTELERARLVRKQHMGKYDYYSITRKGSLQLLKLGSSWVENLAYALNKIDSETKQPGEVAMELRQQPSVRQAAAVGQLIKIVHSAYAKAWNESTEDNYLRICYDRWVAKVLGKEKPVLCIEVLPNKLLQTYKDDSITLQHIVEAAKKDPPIRDLLNKIVPDFQLNDQFKWVNRATWPPSNKTETASK